MAAAMLTACTVGLLLYHLQTLQWHWVGWDMFMILVGWLQFQWADWFVKMALVDHRTGAWDRKP